MCETRQPHKPLLRTLGLYRFVETECDAVPEIKMATKRAARTGANDLSMTKSLQVNWLKWSLATLDTKSCSSFI